MSISATTPKAIEHPEIAFDKLIYGVHIQPQITSAGALSPSIMLTVTRARQLPPSTAGGPDRWEKDTGPNATASKLFQSVEALVAAVPATATLIGPLWNDLNGVVDAVNAQLHLV